MSKAQLPIYQIQDFQAHLLQERYFYLSTLAQHLQEHLFIRKPHKHNFYILLFITRGSGTHTIDFREYAVAPGRVFCLTPGQVHSWDLSDDTDGFVVFFTPEYYQQGFPARKLYRYPFFNTLLQQPCLDLSTDGETACLDVIQKMSSELAARDLMQADMLRHYLDMLLILLTRSYESQSLPAPAPAGMQSQLQALEDLIDRHYPEHRPVGFYADALHLTPKQLNDLCRRSLNKTATDMIQDRILLEAQRLLVHSDLTSSQIAAELGYLDTTYFFRFFKKHLGCTPEQFRQAHR